MKASGLKIKEKKKNGDLNRHLARVTLGHELDKKKESSFLI